MKLSEKLFALRDKLSPKTSFREDALLEEYACAVQFMEKQALEREVEGHKEGEEGDPAQVPSASSGVPSAVGDPASQALQPSIALAHELVLAVTPKGKESLEKYDHEFRTVDDIFRVATMENVERLIRDLSNGLRMGVAMREAVEGVAEANCDDVKDALDLSAMGWTDDDKSALPFTHVWVLPADAMPSGEGSYSDEVLVVDSHGQIDIGQWDHRRSRWTTGAFNGFDVTHWMPLPAPPQPEQQ